MADPLVQSVPDGREATRSAAPSSRRPSSCSNTRLHRFQHRRDRSSRRRRQGDRLPMVAQQSRRHNGRGPVDRRPRHPPPRHRLCLRGPTPAPALHHPPPPRRPHGADDRRHLRRGPTRSELAVAVNERVQAPRREAAKQILRDGIARGELRHDLDPDTTLDILYGPLYYRFLVTHTPTSPRHADRLLDRLWPLLAAPQSGVDRGAPGNASGLSPFVTLSGDWRSQSGDSRSLGHETVFAAWHRSREASDTPNDQYKPPIALAPSSRLNYLRQLLPRITSREAEGQRCDLAPPSGRQASEAGAALT